MITHLVGLDLGQSVDYSAVSVLKRVFTWPNHVRGQPYELGTERLHHEIVALLRWRLKTPYDFIVEGVTGLVGRVTADLEADQVVLVVDSTGVGTPVVDMLRRKRLAPRAITITAGTDVGERENDITVPKVFIVSAFIVAAQNGSLKIAASLREAAELNKQMETFGYKVNRKTGSMSYESSKDTVNDDLVLACALPLWYSMNKISRFWSSGRGMEVQPMANPLA